MHLISHDAIAALIHSYGLLAVFLVVAFESTGLPLPGEAVLLSAAIFAATTHELPVAGVIACAAAGAILGDNCGYIIGRTIGLRVLVSYGHRFGLTQPKLKLGQYLFRRFGGGIVFFGRFIAVLRAFAAVLAGANAYPWPHFLLFNAVGGIVWATLYGGGAYLFGRSIHKVAGPVLVVVVALVLVAGVTGWRFIRRNQAMLQAKAEAAFPEPIKA
jgi:membrane protein DedA with SNARE-associated domain